MRKYIINGVLMTFALAGAAHADDYIITFKDNHFAPAELVIPADAKVKVIIKNADSKPMEFESYDLKREKIVSGNSEASVFIGPVSAGKYEYFDDFHRDSKGVITAK